MFQPRNLGFFAKRINGHLVVSNIRTSRQSASCPSNNSIICNHPRPLRRCFSCNRKSYSNLAVDEKETSSSVHIPMEESYKDHSINQYSAHSGCQDMLENCMKRLRHQIQMEDGKSLIIDPSNNQQQNRQQRRRRLVDLGSADGSNTMKTLNFAFDNIINKKDSSSDKPLCPFHITFEEHPLSNRMVLETTLSNHNDWFKSNNITYSILMKSFYERLFDDNSIDFLMSYICLHWLDNSKIKSISSWKTMKPTSSSLTTTKDNDDCATDKDEHNESDNRQVDFVCINEVQAPKDLKDEWRCRLAKEHLANFLQLRSKELRPNAEMILMMVSHPHEFLCPPNGKPCPLTIALQRCVKAGIVRPELLRDAIIPYYLREEQDIKDSLRLATEAYDAQLDLVDLRQYETITGGGDNSDGTNEGVCNLFWSIHSSILITAGATSEELVTIRECLLDIFDELYDPSKGIRGTFLACVLKKRDV